MNPFLVIIPNTEACNLIFKLRDRITDEGFGLIDSRKKVIPHITITYIEEELTKNQIDDLIKNLDSVVLPKELSLDLINVTNWDKKAVALFNPSDLSKIVDNYRKVFNDLSIKVNIDYENAYGKTIGDHMKIAREIKPEMAEKALNLIKSTMPQQISFEKVAFIGYECEVKDILWEKSLCS